VGALQGKGAKRREGLKNIKLSLWVALGRICHAWIGACSLWLCTLWFDVVLMTSRIGVPGARVKMLGMGLRKGCVRKANLFPPLKLRLILTSVLKAAKAMRELGASPGGGSSLRPSLRGLRLKMGKPSLNTCL
jgi:hypothetical protein